MRASAASPMAPWRSRRRPAACSHWPPIGSRTGRNAKAQRQERVSVAGLIHRREFAAAEIHHARGEPAAPRGPAADVLGINVDEKLRGLAARYVLAHGGVGLCR